MNTPTIYTTGQPFPDLPTAKKAIATYVIDHGESNKVLNSNKEKYSLSAKVNPANSLFGRPLRSRKGQQPVQ
jgi:hypothetical protein